MSRKLKYVFVVVALAVGAGCGQDETGPAGVESTPAGTPTGQDGNGGGGGGDGGGGTAQSDVGKTCTSNAECQSNACLVRSDGDIAGYCSARCESFADCPDFWDCESLGNAAGTYCVQDQE